jgi:peptidoglycan/LPS O-acetylase OafA/YrhL
MKFLRVLIALVPVLAILAGVFFVNHSKPFVLGLPFLFFWLTIWVVGAALAMAIVYRLDPRNRRDGGG